MQTSILEDRQYSKNGHLLPLFYNIPMESMTDEQKLLYHLLKSYDRASRPVFDASMPVTVRLGITLTQILDVVS